MSTQSKSFLTPEEYLEIERKEEWKNEYYRGEMTPMPLPGISHCAIVGNVGGELREQLRKRPDRVYMNALKLFVPSGPLYTYPDVTVVLGKPHVQDRSYDDTLLNPTVIVEVFTKASEAYDRGLKFRLYRSLESLTEYLLISSYEVCVELFTRQSDGTWLLSVRDKMEESIELKSIDCRLSLAEIYYRVDFAMSVF
jgi:Uma2 family endonuclease